MESLLSRLHGMVWYVRRDATGSCIWFGAFVLGAFMSPPDPLSLFLVALPVIFLFEAAMMWDRLTRR